MNKVGELLIEKGIQQKELALAIGVSEPTVSDWVNQKKDPRGANIRKLADFFNVPLQSIKMESPSASATESPNAIVEAVVRPLNRLSDEDLKRIADIVNPNPESPRTFEARIVSFGMDKLPKEDRERLLAMIRALYSNRPELFNNDKKGDTDDARL